MRDLIHEAIGLWGECPDSLPDLSLSFGVAPFEPAQQDSHERELDGFLAAVQTELASIPRNRPERAAAQRHITAAFVRLASAGLGLNSTHLRLLLDGGFSAIGTELGRTARKLGVPATVADIMQASRNAWTACGLQLLYGRPMRLTPSIFAYSMLYPATDNYLDADDVSREEKLGFSLRFGRRLAGEEVPAANPREAEIWRLVTMIEDEYPRAAHPGVHAGLLGIHRAQQESLRFQHRAATAGTDGLLTVSFAKGGASVLADARLAWAEVGARGERFAFLWGVFLQLADDLQDFEDDRASGALTLFTAAAERGTLDAITARTLHFGLRVMGEMDALERERPADGGENWSEPLKELIRTSSRSVVIRSAGELESLYSRGFLAELERYSPCRYAFLRERRKQMARRRAATAMLFEAFLAGEEGEPAFPLLPSSLLPR